VIPQEHSSTHIHSVLNTRARVACGGGSDEESSLLVGIHLVVIRVVVAVVVVVLVGVVVVVMVSWMSGGEASMLSRNRDSVLIENPNKFGCSNYNEQS
jgi:hypothetical protein